MIRESEDLSEKETACICLLGFTVLSGILSRFLVERDGGIKKYSWKIRDLESVYFLINRCGVF